MNKSILVSLSFALLLACGKKEKQNDDYNPGAATEATTAAPTTAAPTTAAPTTAAPTTAAQQTEEQPAENQ